MEIDTNFTLPSCTWLIIEFVFLKAITHLWHTGPVWSAIPSRPSPTARSRDACWPRQQRFWPTMSSNRTSWGSAGNLCVRITVCCRWRPVRAVVAREYRSRRKRSSRLSRCRSRLILNWKSKGFYLVINHTVKNRSVLRILRHITLLNVS